MLASRLVVSATLVAAFAADVPQYRVNPQHTGVYEPVRISGKPYLKWRFKTANKVRSTPAVAGDTLLVGSDDGRLYAMSARDGKLQWAFQAGGRVASSPAVDAGVVYFSTDRRIYAASVARGKQLWSFAFGLPIPPPDTIPGDLGPRDFGLWDYYLSSPCVANGKVYVGSADGKLYALDGKTGARVWAFQTDAPIRTAPAVDAGVVYFGTMGGEFFAVDASTGQERWRFKVEGNQYFPHGGIQSSPAVAKGLVIFGSRDYFVYALNGTDGRLRWKTQHKDSWVVSPPTVAHGLVYVGSSDAKFIQALDVETGAEKWRQSTGANVFGAIAIAGDLAISADWDGKVAWYDAKTGKQLGGFIFENRINSSPVVSGGHIYIGGDDDYISAIAFRPE